MATELKKGLSWEINNLSEIKDVIMSDPFSSGGCNWRVSFDTKGIGGCTLVLFDANPNSLRLGWKRMFCFCFVLLNQSGKEIYRSPNEGRSTMICAEIPAIGFSTNMSLSTIGFNKLTIEVYIKVAEVVHQGPSTHNDMVDYMGFHIPVSQVFSVSEISFHHPYFAEDFKAKNIDVKTAYLNLLLGLNKTLNKSPQSLSASDLNNAQSELNKLTEAGFKLDWLKSKLEEISLETMKAYSDGTWVQQLEERVKNVETNLSNLKVELKKEKMKSATRVDAFVLIDCLIRRLFPSCFSISK